jgi:hypothetical protein
MLIDIPLSVSAGRSSESRRAHCHAIWCGVVSYAESAAELAADPFSDFFYPDRS